MNKTHLTVGVLAVLLVAGVAASRSSQFGSSDSSAAASLGSTSNGFVLVTYDDKGFTPAVVKVARGTSVHFLNTGGRALRIAPVADPAYNTVGYQGVLASKSVKQGDFFETSMSVPGVWGYKNLQSTGSVGIVIVE